MSFIAAISLRKPQSNTHNISSLQKLAHRQIL